MLATTLHGLLLQGFHRSNRAMISALTPIGLLPGQPKILEFLIHKEGATQKEIGQGCVLDKSTVTSLLSRMIANGLVTKETSPTDGRASLIFLTEKGRALAKQVEVIGAQVDEQAWQGISPQEQAQFIQTFQKILKNQQKEEN
jgi:DNA-binding MarR family transcriptional regulator